MGFVEDFKKQVFKINEKTFVDSSLAVFEYQFHQCEIYREYCNSLNKNPTNVNSLEQIPFLPIEFFKNHVIKSGDWKEVKVFKSSGTTSSSRSQHFVRDIEFYHFVAKHTFEKVFGRLQEFTLLALLPSYQEQGDSSLISMIDHFMSYSKKGSDYFLHKEMPKKLSDETQKVVFGVSYALLDAVHAKKSKNTLLIETGGMKGRKKEITREELHINLKMTWNSDEIWSEYGMTELMSQAYGKNGEFRFPPWAKTLIREVNDPFSYLSNGATGGINVIDLANIDTCAFIETKDLGRIRNEIFEVLGRFDNSDIRGCNLMV